MDDEEAGDAGGQKKSKKKRGKKKKRKGVTEDAAAAAGAVAAVADEEAADEEKADGGEKKKKKRPKKLQSGTDATGTMGTAEAQAAFLWERYCELLDLSPLDRDVPRFPPGRFVLPPPAAGDGKKKGQDKGKDGGKGATVPETGVTGFLKRALPGLQKLASDKANRVVGRPLVVVVSPAAVRANDLAKELRVRLPNQRTAKLFAKHIKAQEQAEALGKEFNALAVGTPARLAKLLEMGAFSLANCRLLVLDASIRDAKQFTLLTLPGVAKDVALLLKEHVLPVLEKQGKGKEAAPLQIALF